MDVSVIIPNWNGGERLARTLESVRKQSVQPAEVIVVDNGSGDGSDDAAEAAGARVVRLGGNTGFAPAVNRGIAEARADLLLILNNDVELTPRWLERTSGVLAGGGVWHVCGKLLDSRDHNLVDGTFDLICTGGAAWRCGAGRPDGGSLDRIHPAELVPFTAVLLRKELFHRLGLLDEAFGSYLEDVDFGLRCASKGYSGVYVPDALAYHIGSATWGRWSSATVRQISRNQLLLIARRYPARLIRQCGWEIAVAQILWGLVAVRHGRGWAWLTGKLDGFRIFRNSRGTGDDSIEKVLIESEKQLYAMQAENGFDLYWRLYFALTRRRW